ncbi:pentraxin-related protein PTX3-like [Ciona intestinalis]
MQITDYVRYRAYFPMLTSATVCMWLQTENYRTAVLASYANLHHNNELTIRLLSTTRIRFKLGGVEVGDFPVSQLNRTRKVYVTRVHICTAFSSQLGKILIYINGVKEVDARYDGSYALGGGDLLLGQEQDEIDAGRLDPRQAFSGQITNFLIWPRVLRDDEVRSIVTSCECPRDHAVMMSPDRVEIHGQASYNVSVSCPVLTTTTNLF